MGTGAVLVVTAATWVFWGGVLIYLGHRVQLPVLILLAVWVAYCSLTNDNHDLRTVTPTKAYTRPRLADALDAWHKRIAAKYPGQIHPLYIVASEGGGIRAAYWTAAVLGTIQDEQPAFADHVFAISGVSGGSLGAVVFASLRTERLIIDRLTASDVPAALNRCWAAIFSPRRLRRCSAPTFCNDSCPGASPV